MDDAYRSPRYSTVKDYYEKKLWNEARVEKAVLFGWITEVEKNEILGIIKP